MVPVYRPCFGQSEGSMRLVLDIDYNGKFEEHFWSELKLASEGGNVIVGGDFNLSAEKMPKTIVDHDLDVRMTANPGEITF